MTVRLARGTPGFVALLWFAPLVVASRWARLVVLLSAAGCTWFFRDPRRTPKGEGLLAAADGVVQWVRTDERGRETISTYLNLLDVHVTRAPCDATVVQQTYRRGRHRPAFSPSAHRNERMEWTLATAHGDIVLIQYAGTVARRIVTHKRTGDVLRRGEAIGLIRFGSRVDVVLPVGVSAAAGEGDRMYGGATVIATPDVMTQPSGLT
ncbi:MAG TPA: phosphatidylserine decarboxylase [Nocardioidaceae bacterium]|jgi:phosphatidylserine decarboxylase